MSNHKSKKPLPRQPKIATKEHILGLLCARSLPINTPLKVAEAVFLFLHKEGFFITQASGHIDIFDDPQATLKEPSEAARSLCHALGRFKKKLSKEEVDILGRIVRFPSNPIPPSFDGSCYARPSTPPSKLEKVQGKLKEATDVLEKAEGDLDRLCWDEDSHISSFGDDAKAEATIIVKHNIEQAEEKVEVAKERKKQAQREAEKQGQEVTAKDPGEKKLPVDPSTIELIILDNDTGTKWAEAQINGVVVSTFNENDLGVQWMTLEELASVSDHEMRIQTGIPSEAEARRKRIDRLNIFLIKQLSLSSPPIEKDRKRGVYKSVFKELSVKGPEDLKNPDVSGPTQ